jgi:hypothetical protein
MKTLTGVSNRPVGRYRVNLLPEDHEKWFTSKFIMHYIQKNHPRILKRAMREAHSAYNSLSGG